MVQTLWMMIVLAAAILIGTPGAAGTDPTHLAEETALPKAILTRLFDHGATETINLRCAKDRSGKQEFFCEVRRFRNGVEVATTNLYAKQTKAILASFLGLVPAGDQRNVNAPTPERESSSKSDVPKGEPMLTWDISFGGKLVQGTLYRHQQLQKIPVVDAVLSLEGALDSQLYR